MNISNLGNMELNHCEFWIQEGQILPSWTVMAKAASLKFLRLYFLFTDEYLFYIFSVSSDFSEWSDECKCFSIMISVILILFHLLTQ